MTIVKKAITMTAVAEAMRSRQLPPTRIGTGVRRAAVAAILRESAVDKSDIEMLFIRRAERQGDPWSGHVALPGGHVEAQDKNLAQTAIRETREEINLDLKKNGRLLGPLQTTEPQLKGGKRVGTMVASFVFSVTGEHKFTLSDEVDSAFWMSLHDLLADERRTSVCVKIGGEDRHFPALDLNGPVLWGMTYRMLSELLSILQTDRLNAKAGDVF